MGSPGTTRRSATRVELRTPTDKLTAVPYMTPDDPKRRFIDLRVNPDLIDLIDDLRGRPAMRDQVELLSAPNSPLRTIRCACATHRVFRQIGPPAWTTASTLQITFVEEGANDMTSCIALARILHDELASKPRPTRWNRLVELWPALVALRPDHVTWSMCIRTSGYGLDAASAAHEWSLCLHAQTAVLALWIGNLDRVADANDTVSTEVHRRGRSARPRP